MTLKRSNQLLDNHMDVYADMDDYSLNEDQYNLFTLRAESPFDLQSGRLRFCLQVRPTASTLLKAGPPEWHFISRHIIQSPRPSLTWILACPLRLGCYQVS